MTDWRMAAIRFILLPIVLSFGLALSACGNGTSGATRSYPAPFNTANGESKLIDGSLVTTYPTGATSSTASTSYDGVEASTLPALDEYYVDTICPNGITQAQCQQNEANLNTPDFGNFDLSTDPIGNNPLNIQQVDADEITYGAINVGGAAVTVSGGIVIPELPAASIRGIVLFFHGTTIQRSNVPSNFITADNPGGYYAGILMAAVWASQGYVVVMPDFIGLGVDTADPHPYVVYPQENAQSGLAMVKAARTYLAGKLSGRMPLFITGYSEGGAYSLEAAHLMQTNPRYAAALNVRLKETVPISGVFDLTGTMLPYLFYNISNADNPWFSLSPLTSALSKPYLSGDLAMSFAYYDNIAPTDIVVDPFYTCTQSNQPNCGTSGNLNGLYYEADIADTTAVIAMVGQASQTSFTTNNNSVQPLLTPDYATALMDGDVTNPLYAALLNANTYLFTPKFPLVLVSLQNDSVVTRVNTDVAWSYFTTQNPTGPYQEFLVDNSLFLVPGLFSAAQVDHLTELPFLAVLALNQFNSSS